jgi:hypothetical protein
MRVEEEEEEVDRFNAMTFDHLFYFNWTSFSLSLHHEIY